MSKSNSLEYTEYFILLALADEPAHGQAVTDQIIGDSVGGVYLRPSTLYGALKNLEKREFILQSGTAEAANGHVYKKIYKLTDKGQWRLADLARMHERAARLAKARLGLRY